MFPRVERPCVATIGMVVLCQSCSVAPNDSPTLDDGTTTSSTTETGGSPDPCAVEACPSENPCQNVDCCPPGDLACTPIFHDTQVVFLWSDFSTDCTNGCHGDAPPAGGLSLLADSDPWCALVNKPSSGTSPLSLVEPGSPLQSYLWHKLNGTHACPDVGGEGEAMPPGGCPLATDVPIFFDLVTEWICCGAPKSPDDPLGEQCF